MSYYNLKPIRLDFKPSRLLMGLLIAVALASCLLLITMPWPWTIRLAVISLVLLATAWHLLDAAKRLPGSCVALAVNGKGEMKLSYRSGRQTEVSVLGTSFVSPWLMVLNYRCEGQRMARSVVMLPDSAEAEDLRRLRVWLRWGRQAASLADTA